jgi:hypothetical protein
MRPQQQWWTGFDRHISFNEQSGVLTFLAPPPTTKQLKQWRENYINRWAGGEEKLIENMKIIPSQDEGRTVIIENERVVQKWKKALYTWLENTWFVQHPKEDPTIEDVNEGVKIEGYGWRWYDTDTPRDRNWSTVLYAPLDPKQRQGRRPPEITKEQEKRRKYLKETPVANLTDEEAAEFLYFPQDTEQEQALFRNLRPWLFNQLNTQGKLENTAGLTEALEATLNHPGEKGGWWKIWKVPYELDDGKPMETVVSLHNWLVDKLPNLPVIPKGIKLDNANQTRIHKCKIKKSGLEDAKFMGLFADEVIEEDDLIVFYNGVLYNDQAHFEEERNKGESMDKDNRPAKLQYVMDGPLGEIDGYRGFSLLESGRWANTLESREWCNAEYRSVDHLGLIFLEATQRIEEGNEIFAWYSKEYNAALFYKQHMQKYLKTRGIDEKRELEKKIKSEDANVSDVDATELANNLFYWLTKWFKKNIDEPRDDAIISNVRLNKEKWDGWRKVLAPLILY